MSTLQMLSNLVMSWCKTAKKAIKTDVFAVTIARSSPFFHHSNTYKETDTAIKGVGVDIPHRSNGKYQEPVDRPLKFP